MQATHYRDKSGFPVPIPLNSMFDKYGFPVFLGARVSHGDYGTGDIVYISGDFCQILFNGDVHAMAFHRREIAEFEKELTDLEKE